MQAGIGASDRTGAIIANSSLTGTFIWRRFSVAPAIFAYGSADTRSSTKPRRDIKSCSGKRIIVVFRIIIIVQFYRPGYQRAGETLVGTTIKSGKTIPLQC